MTNKRGRNAETGEFTTIKEAQKHPKTHVVETVPTRKPAPAPAPKRGK